MFYKSVFKEHPKEGDKVRFIDYDIGKLNGTFTIGDFGERMFVTDYKDHRGNKIFFNSALDGGGVIKWKKI